MSAISTEGRKRMAGLVHPEGGKEAADGSKPSHRHIALLRNTGDEKNKKGHSSTGEGTVDRDGCG